jgi:hypothetical protein
MTKQQIRVTTASGSETLDADRILIESEEYVILNGQVEVRRIAIADIVAEGESSGIETIYSRS